MFGYVNELLSHLRSHWHTLPVLSFVNLLNCNLGDSQKKVLEVYASETLNDSRVRLHNRTLRQKVFIKFLKTKPTEVELTNYLNKLLLKGHMITNPSYETFTEISVKKFHTLLVNMLDKSSIIQRERIVTKLRNYA